MRTSKKIFGFVVVMTIILLLPVQNSCTPPTPPEAPVPSPSGGAPKSPGTVSVDTWDELVKAAKKEGTVNIYGSEIKPATDLLTEAFRKQFGMNLDVIQGRSAEVVAKISAETRAGLYLGDAAHMGITSMATRLKPLGVTKPFSDLLLPEVKNPKNWMGGQVLWGDPEQTILIFTTIAAPSILINTDMVRKGQITSFLDLLKPEWKSKMVFGDPTMSGPPTNTLASWIKIFGREKGLEMIKQFAAQEPMITRDYRLMIEWVARGKYSVGIGPSQSIYSDFKEVGAPIEFLIQKEPSCNSDTGRI